MALPSSVICSANATFPQGKALGGKFLEEKILTRTRAQELRRNATKEENHLWYDFLKNYPLQFNRQKPFGPYFVDFYCDRVKLVIELDGAQHYEDTGIEYDTVRTEYLQNIEKLRVLRFTNRDIKENFEGVCAEIDQTVKSALPSSVTASPCHLPPGEGLRRTMKTVTIYTDGACSGNPGPGGWGAILLYGAHKRELSGGEKQTTNNRMELTGVIEALRALKEPCTVELYSDSKYVIDALEKGWARGWKARGWVKSDKTPALNPDLWEVLLGLCDYPKVNLHWVKGHASNPYNNRCDELAVAESQRFK